ncbi:MAG: hypothetical protein ACOYM2_10520 [Rectinemataceae bacterium]
MLESSQNEIRVASLDPEINQILREIPAAAPDSASKIQFNQSEDLFLSLSQELFYPRLQIHHDIALLEPSASYAQALKRFVRDLALVLPSTLSGLTYYFDPAETLKPCFYRLYKVEESIYLYHLRIDLAQRPFEGEVLEPGTNDHTAAYSSPKLFLESEVIPLDAVMWELGRVRAFHIHQLISNTWIGETKRGHYVQGIWMDDNLSKFFTKLFQPVGTRIYPWFPFFCKYKTVCASVPNPGPEARRRIMPLLHRAINFLKPEMEKIQTQLRNEDFSENMPGYQALLAKIPPAWREVLTGYSSRPYLNARDMKEFVLETPDRKRP